MRLLGRIGQKAKSELDKPTKARVMPTISPAVFFSQVETFFKHYWLAR